MSFIMLMLGVPSGTRLAGKSKIDLQQQSLHMPLAYDGQGAGECSQHSRSSPLVRLNQRKSPKYNWDFFFGGPYVTLLQLKYSQLSSLIF